MRGGECALLALQGLAACRLGRGVVGRSGEPLGLDTDPEPSLTPSPCPLPLFSLRECQLEPMSLSRLCETLEKCPGPLEVK